MIRIVRTVGVITAMLLCMAPLAGAQSSAPSNPILARAIDQTRGLDADALVALGLSRAPGIAALSAAVTAAAGRQSQSALGPNPELTFEQRQQLGGGDRATTVGLMWPLEIGKVGPRKEAAGADTAVAQARLAETRRLLERIIRSNYADVLAAGRALTVALRQRDTAAGIVRLAEERADSGSGSALEREQAAIEVAIWNARVVDRERILELSRLRLLQSVGASPTDGLTVRGDLADLGYLKGITTSDAGAAVTNRADVQEATAAVQAARGRTQVAQSQNGWDVGVFGDYMNTTMSFNQLGLTPTGAAVPIAGRFQSIAGGLSIRLPIKNHNQGAVAAASAEELAAERRLQETRLAAEHEVAGATISLEQTRRAVQILRDEAVTRGQANVGVVREAYSLGVRPLADVLSEMRRLDEIESEYTEALVTCYRAWVDFKAATAVGESK